MKSRIPVGPLAQTGSIHPLSFDARAETGAEKPLFRSGLGRTPLQRAGVRLLRMADRGRQPESPMGSSAGGRMTSCARGRIAAQAPLVLGLSFHAT
jgi:hypothetical protein